MTDFADVEKSGKLLSRTSLGVLALESAGKDPSLSGESVFGIPLDASAIFAAPIFPVIVFVLIKFLLLSAQYHFGQIVSTSSFDANALSQSNSPQLSLEDRREMSWYNREVIESLEDEIMRSSTTARFSQNTLFFITFTGPAVIALVALTFSFDSFLSFLNNLLS